MKYFNVLFFVLMLAMNYLANALPLNGKNTGELSAQYPNLFVPAGITFSIWGIIYLMLAVVLFLQFVGNYKDWVKLVGWAFIISSFFNAAWIWAWHYEKMSLSILFMFAILASLVFINHKLNNAYQDNNLIKATFGIYLGWICVAAIANITAALVSINWGGFGMSHESWSIIMIVSGGIIVYFAAIYLHNPFLGLAVAWAFAGIVLNRMHDYPPIAMVAGLMAFLSLLYSSIMLYRQM